MNKKVKITIFVLLFIVLVILVKSNVTIEKESPSNLNEEKKVKDVTALDIKSKLVKDLYKSLNMELINNTCNNYEKCLINENYLYIYYNDNKVLSDDEMLYLTLNKIYRDGKYSTKNESNEDSNDNNISKIVIDKIIVKEELKSLFNRKYKDFDNKLIQSNSCGIKEYTFTGEAYELTIKKCKSNNKDYVLSRVIKASKSGDKVTLVIEKYTEKTDEKESIKKYEESSETKNYERYNFIFKLNEDKYYIEKITKLK